MNEPATPLARLRAWARALRDDVIALWFACRDPATPWLPKALGLFVVGYALSPIDLIPDFIPVIGYLDDLILLPGLIWLALRLLPADLRDRCRARARDWLASRQARPSSRVAAAVIVGVWLAAGWLAWRWWAGR